MSGKDIQLMGNMKVAQSIVREALGKEDDRKTNIVKKPVNLTIEVESEAFNQKGDITPIFARSHTDVDNRSLPISFDYLKGLDFSKVII